MVNLMLKSRAAALILPLFLCLAAPVPAVSAVRDLNAELVNAAGVGRPDEITALIAEGAKPDAARNTEGETVLSIAARRTDREAVDAIDALLKGGANIDLADESGQTALFYAAREGNRATVHFLLRRGAQYYLTDKKGEIARTYAHKAGHSDIVTLMDDFIHEETEKTLALYRERNKPPAPLEARPAPIAPPSPAPAARPVPKPLDAQALRAGVHRLSFQACTLEYWKFMRFSRQELTVDRDALKTRIETHEKLMIQAEEALVREFGASADYTRNIRDTSRARIRAVLQGFANNAQRAGAGIGEPQDAEDRCEEIADSWELGVAK